MAPLAAVRAARPAALTPALAEVRGWTSARHAPSRPVTPLPRPAAACGRMHKVIPLQHGGATTVAQLRPQKRKVPAGADSAAGHSGASRSGEAARYALQKCAKG